MRMPSVRSRFARPFAATAFITAALVAVPAAAHAAPTPPDVIPALSGYNAFWTPDSRVSPTVQQGTVDNPDVMAYDDELAVWINRSATGAQQFKALQDAEYDNTGTAYDQSITVGTGLGTTLGALYIAGRNDGSLPLTSALINSETGSAGAFVSTGKAKSYFSHPRPYIATDPNTPATPGDAAVCAPSVTNATSLSGNRVGRPWASAGSNTQGDLLIERVADTVDTTHQFSPNDVPISAGYGTAGICQGGSFPSGHTTTAYQAGITLATLLPELAPEILSRASENGNDRIVLGVHYPLDVMGGRIAGEVALSTLWSDADYRTTVLEPARAELVAYLEAKCGDTLANCIAAQASAGGQYEADPYGGQAFSADFGAQIVTDRATAVAAYQQRLTYGFGQVGTPGLAPDVPAGAENLLLTTFPTLSDAQRTSVLAQTQIDSGFPLDLTGSGSGSWQRLDLAAAMSATVELEADGSVRVLSTGGAAQVVTPAGPSPAPAGGGAAAAPAGKGALAATGLDAGAIGGAGTLVLAAGALLLVGLRRRTAR
ncbi:phosphatase PAP2 family protein [Cnuibacter sp. UC19_7]|uniref:phosphatase PAP2 family protein n=1 Tax=Cnuibacter sp. UC19_7 TaxID=3350166 RepID=UPI00366D22D7